MVQQQVRSVHHLVPVVVLVLAVHSATGSVQLACVAVLVLALVATAVEQEQDHHVLAFAVEAEQVHASVVPVHCSVHSHLRCSVEVLHLQC
jgi:hypothetical protein